MARFWICHWLFRNWRTEIQREGQPVRLAGSNSFRKRGVSVGDSVYIVSLGAGQLYLGGRMVVERIVSRREALRLWNDDDLYDDAEEWVVGPEESGTLLHLHRRLSPTLTKQLRFLSKTAPREPFFVSEMELSSQATRGLPELTPESAALLDRVIDVTDRLPRTGQLLTVTEQMLGVGESAAGREESRLLVESPRGLPHFSSAFELLKPGETGLFIYTDGLNLEIHEDGTGESGWWVLNPGRPFDRAFIFKRSEADQEAHEILSGRCTGFEGPDGNRWKLLLADVRLEGKTLTNWTEFAVASQNPIRFLECPNPTPEQVMNPDPLQHLDAGRRGERPSMTPESIREAFARVQYRRDGRRPPDERRRGQFRAGWEDATNRGWAYRSETLDVLTWRNLGNRLGERFGDERPEQINGAFDLLASLYRPIDGGGAHSLPDDEEDETALLPFDPQAIDDARARVLAPIYQRRGQAEFREALLRAYDSTCCFSGCTVEQVLEAAHIIPYQGQATNHVRNGLLLRTDLHTLFDLGLLTVDAATMTIVVDPALRGSIYAELDGRRIRLPRHPRDQPAPEFLEYHRDGVERSDGRQ